MKAHRMKDLRGLAVQRSVRDKRGEGEPEACPEPQKAHSSERDHSVIHMCSFLKTGKSKSISKRQLEESSPSAVAQA